MRIQLNGVARSAAQSAQIMVLRPHFDSAFRTWLMLIQLIGLVRSAGYKLEFSGRKAAIETCAEWSVP